MKNIVIFKIDKKLDFQNHLIGSKFYKTGFIIGSPLFIYYKKLAKAKNIKERRKIFNEKSSNFYKKSNAKFRKLMTKQIQEVWNTIERDFIFTIEKIHNRKFPHKRIHGILSTGGRFGYSTDKKWFACNYDSPVRAVDTAMHEIMHFIFYKYFYNQWKKKFKLTDKQIWTIKEAVTVILNTECGNFRFDFDRGHNGHENLRKKIEKDWIKYKDFENVLNCACEYVKNNKLFLK